MRLALSDPPGFWSVVEAPGLDPNARAWAEYQLAILQHLDVLILNEADAGLARTGYRDAAAELAGSLAMHRAFGVEFVEVDPAALGLEGAPVDEDRYRGLHGSAVLSRYPIRHAQVIRLPDCYDWYGQEAQDVAEIERGKRWSASMLFLARVSREIRHGGRMAMIVELEIPDLPSSRASVVVSHFENRSSPSCRGPYLGPPPDHGRSDAHRQPGLPHHFRQE
ncbi:MAG: hypothetical protein FJW37_04470 [Acidobacteria bacterium]|nr:hypothetical protein [Acidobacteriota bacterium]